MEYIWFLAAAVLFLYIRYRQNEARRRRLFTERLKERWGQVPDQEYGEEDLRRIRRYFERFRGGEYVLDDITWNDLDMDEVFMLLNHTNSSAGEEALYRLLRTPCTDLSVLLKRDRLAAVLAENPPLRLELEKQLAAIGKNSRQALCDYIANLSGQPCRSNGFHYIGLAALAAAAASIAIWPDTGILALGGMIGFQMIVYYQQKAQVESYFSCVSQVVRMAVHGRAIAALKDSEALSEYLTPLRASVKELEPFCAKSRFISAGKAMGGSPFDLIMDYVKMLLHTDLIAYNQIVRMTKDKETAIWRVTEILGQLECGLAIASLRSCLGQWCRPQLTAGEPPYLHGEGLYHPLVDRAVPNTIYARRNQLITGSNASGKSTFLKTVALSAVLAQTTYTAPGVSYRAPLYQIYTSMALRDSLQNGESYYIAEIRSLKRILDRGRDRLPVLCMIDEVLRGTNTVERIAASAQILRSMADMNLLCFAATHDAELAQLLEPWYENGHFSEEIAGGDVLFSYRLKPGRTKSRNALLLLELMGYEETVLRQAQEMAEHFGQTGVWSMDVKERAHGRASTEIHRDGDYSSRGRRELNAPEPEPAKGRR